MEAPWRPRHRRLTDFKRASYCPWHRRATYRNPDGALKRMSGVDRSWSMRVSCPERTILEILDEIPTILSFSTQTRCSAVFRASVHGNSESQVKTVAM